MKFITGNTNKDKKILILNDFYRPDEWVNLSLIMLVDKLNNYPFHTVIYGDPSTKLSIEEWAKVQSADTPIPDFLEKELQTHDGVIGIELPKFIINKLNQINIPYINYHHSPYRFCGINPKIWSIETAIEISNSYIPKLTPNRLISEHSYEVGTLIIGQTKYDRVLIKNNKFLSVNSVKHNENNILTVFFGCNIQKFESFFSDLKISDHSNIIEKAFSNFVDTIPTQNVFWLPKLTYEDTICSNNIPFLKG
jgi:hypothetical protein